MESYNLVLLGSGRTSRYDLHPDYEYHLDELKSQFSSYGIGILRAARNAAARATFAHRQLLVMQDIEPQTRAKLEKYRAKYELLAQAHFSTLVAMGISPHIRVLAPPLQRDTYSIEKAEVVARHRNDVNWTVPVWMSVLDFPEKSGSSKPELDEPEILTSQGETQRMFL